MSNSQGEDQSTPEPVKEPEEFFGDPAIDEIFEMFGGDFDMAANYMQELLREQMRGGGVIFPDEGVMRFESCAA